MIVGICVCVCMCVCVCVFLPNNGDFWLECMWQPWQTESFASLLHSSDRGRRPRDKQRGRQRWRPRQMEPLHRIHKTIHQSSLSDSDLRLMSRLRGDDLCWSGRCTQSFQVLPSTELFMRSLSEVRSSFNLSFVHYGWTRTALITARDAYTEREPKHLPTLNMNTFTRGGVAVQLSQNRRAFHELNKYRLGLTLRHRGFGQLNRDMSLSNRAGKLQNGHLKRRERQTYDADNSSKKKSHWEETQRHYFRLATDSIISIMDYLMIIFSTCWFMV